MGRSKKSKSGKGKKHQSPHTTWKKNERAMALLLVFFLLNFFATIALHVKILFAKDHKESFRQKEQQDKENKTKAM